MLNEINIDRRKLVLLLAVWTGFGLFFGLQNYVRDIYFGHPASLPGYIIGWIFCGYSWAVLTFPVLWFARRLSLRRIGWLKFLVVHVPAGVAFSLVQLGIYLSIATLIEPQGDRSTWNFYKFLLANELQSSVLVYFAMISVITVYDRFFEISASDRSTREPASGIEAPSVDGHSNGFLHRIPVKENGKIVLVDVDDIVWIESYGNYLFLHTANGKHIFRETMASMETKLDPSRFVRIRRSAIVRIDQIRELHPTDNSEFEIVLVNGSVLSSTRRYRKNLEAVLRT
jgi:hypothetical protein